MDCRLDSISRMTGQIHRRTDALKHALLASASSHETIGTTKSADRQCLESLRNIQKPLQPKKIRTDPILVHFRRGPLTQVRQNEGHSTASCSPDRAEAAIIGIVQGN